MGIAFGDYHHTGRLSIAVTHFSDEYNTLSRNDGNLELLRRLLRRRSRGGHAPWVGWGDAFVDLDNDGWLDLIAVNGHVYPQVDSREIGTRYREPKLLFLNLHNGKFRDVSKLVGPALQIPQVSRGLAVADLFNDGNLELVIEDLEGSP